MEVFGNLTGLKPATLKRLERLYHRRVPPQSVISPELAKEICELSAEIKRQIGLLINRKGHIDYVIVGSYHQIVIPELKGYKESIAKLKGVRLVHTHLVKDLSLTSKKKKFFSNKRIILDEDDLMDLVFLRLDLVAAIETSLEGKVGRLQMAHIFPEPEKDNFSDLSLENFFYFYPPRFPWEMRENVLEIIQILEEELERIKPFKNVHDNEDRAILIFLKLPGDIDIYERVQELRELARTAGVNVVGEVIQQRATPDARYLIGKGKLMEVMLEALKKRANLLIFDRELTPSQVRALTEVTDLRVIDRTQLILDIFAQRASSKEGKIQVEIAQLKYALPRLRAKDDAFSRLTGGIGGRGPGETKLEIDRRRIKDKIAKLEKEIAKLSSQRELRRKKRKRKNFKIVSLIGYTNTGKTTLLNYLSKSQYLAEDKLFATLDPVTKAVKLPNKEVILVTDTVGFIRDMPEELKRAFKATLEELYSADLFLHMVDITNPDFETHIEVVENLLEEMKLIHYPRILVFNKIDLLSEKDFLEGIKKRYPEAVFISCKTGENIEKLLEKISENLNLSPVSEEIKEKFSYSQSSSRL